LENPQNSEFLAISKTRLILKIVFLEGFSHKSGEILKKIKNQQPRPEFEP
jgi:hypothetical protein